MILVGIKCCLTFQIAENLGALTPKVSQGKDDHKIHVISAAKLKNCFPEPYSLRCA